MKKYVSVALLSLMALFVAVPAQAGIFSWGVEGGVNLSKMKISKDIADAENRTGFFAGLKGEVAIPIAGLAVDASVLYSQKYMAVDSWGTKWDDKGVASYYPTTRNKSMPYLEVPVNIKWKFGFSSILGIYVATGPQWNYFLGGKNFSVSEFTTNGVEDWKGEFNKTTFSWNIGAGVNAFSHLTVGVNANLPLGNTADLRNASGWEIATEKANFKNITYQVRAAWWF